MTRLLAVAAAVLLVAGCGTSARFSSAASDAAPTPADLATLVPRDGRLSAPLVRSGVEALSRGDYVRASRALGRAIKLDPQNGALHFLNGLAYHLRAAAGDGSQYQLAEVGYHLALQFSPTLHVASTQLGRLQFSQGRFGEAQNAFAYTLLFDQKDPALWLALAAASYHAQDLHTATFALKAAERLQPEKLVLLKTGALIRAAAGLSDEARRDVAWFRALSPSDTSRLEHLTRRLDDWRDTHRRLGNVALAQAQPSPLDRPPSPATPAVAPPARPATQPRMVLVDVVLIRSEERYTTNRGVNLLTGLSLQFSGSLARTRSQTGVYPPDQTSTALNTLARVLMQTITMPAITYNLNIFNDNDDQNEVMARPTLTAVDGKPSEFFTGGTLHVLIGGAAGSQGTLQEIPVGVKLAVTPAFIDDETVQLQVEASRTFIEDQTATTTFVQFAQTTSTKVTASVVLKLGETLILSGLSEKETERIKNGVPILKSIPGVQYLFSNENTVDFTKSVLILLTPRAPSFTNRLAGAQPQASRTAPPRKDLEELKGRLGEFKPAPNLDAVFFHLGRAEMFREFREGDVSLERWEDPFSLRTILRRTLRFLYY